MNNIQDDVIDVAHLATLTNLQVTEAEVQKLTSQFGTTLETIATLSELQTAGIVPTAQVTGLVNVTREDQIDTQRMFTQDQALANAHQTHHGYIVVPAILNGK
jgi:aspartyl-tRNA(Asn)/glutamyl-tRNA(Gln) amidotransferase subunit C